MGFMGVHNPSGYKLQTHEYVTACYGKSSRRMVGYPTWIVIQAFGIYEIWDDLLKGGLFGSSTYVGLNRGQLAGRDIGEYKARTPCSFQIYKTITVNG